MTSNKDERLFDLEFLLQSIAVACGEMLKGKPSKKELRRALKRIRESAQDALEGTGDEP